MTLVVELDKREEPDIIRNRRSSTTEQHWWQLDPGPARAARIQQTVELIETHSSSRRAADELFMRSYGFGNVAGDGVTGAMRWQSRQPFKLRLNLIEQVCDAMQAKVAKLRPRPAFQTTQAEWGLRKRAEAMEQAVDGEFYRNKVDELSPQVALDAFVIGTGHWRVGRGGYGYPIIERVFPGEISVDAMEGMYQQPRSLYRTRLLDREFVIENWARKDKALADRIRSVSSTNPRSFPWLRTAPGHTDTLWVIESWRLPMPDGEGGLHTLTVADIELLKPSATKYDCQEFPIIAYRWQNRQFGYFGRGIAEEIMPQQLEINYTLEKIQHIFQKVSTVRHYIQRGGSVSLNVQKMTNYPGEIIEFTGANPPITDATNAVPSEMFQHVIDCKNDAFAAVGLSQFFASSEKPAGLDSGEAQRVYEDVGTERLILKGRSYEQCHIEIAQRVVDTKRAIANSSEKEKPTVVKAKRARGVTIRSLKWNDIELEPDTYLLELLPQSALPGTPTGRKATVSEWLQLGLITPEDGRELLNMPDTKAANDMHFATRDSVLSAIELMADDGAWVAPHPMLNLQEAKQLVATAYTRLEWEGCPEGHLELIARYFDAVLKLEALAQPPAPMGQLPALPAQMPPVAAA